VLRDLVEGLTREAIARRRGVTPRVVAADVAAVYRAFDLERSELTSAQRQPALGAPRGGDLGAVGATSRGRGGGG